MARKKKLVVDKHRATPRGAEHIDAEPVLAPRTRDLRLDAEGRELVSSVPITLHVKQRLIGDPELIRAQIAAIRATSGPVTFETFEEADDFDLEDDYGDFTSRWEIPADHDDAVEAYKRYRATGEIPVDIREAFESAAGSGPRPAQSIQDSSPPPAPTPQGSNNPGTQSG